MHVPLHTIKATAGFGCWEEMEDTRLEYRKLSALFELREKGYHLNEADTSRVLKHDSPLQPVNRRSDRCGPIDCAAPLPGTNGGFPPSPSASTGKHRHVVTFQRRSTTWQNEPLRNLLVRRQHHQKAGGQVE